ncbi:DNA cytosine methyltransferase [Methylovorus sp. MP688]|uniref:DNA cytosine methyltransferase n=1 Tax=Methylovorus sp. (strain MP688) TaxID=887061 RepID=UPI0001EC4D12|nr:DNA cytosine methyltransferase [Methylovorus sp. MP688]ADQ85191.1 putative modification methylase [Methylovorus sp. MP688]
MKAVELFSGIGGFRLACDNKNIRTVFANDIKTLACDVYASQFGTSVLHRGDIKDFFDKIPDHDLLTAGFPCQPFSSAGKKEGIRDPRGTLFQSIVKTLDKNKPKYFILENVKRLLSMENGEHFATILQELSTLGYCVEWRLINAIHFGLPQNRQRLFITGIRDHEPKIRLLPKSDIDQLSSGHLILARDPSRWQEINVHGKAFPNWGLAKEGKFLGCNVNKFSDAAPPVLLRDILSSEVPSDFDFTETTLSWLANNTPVNRYYQGVEIISNQGGGARMGYTIYGINGVSPTLTASTSRHYERYKVGEKFRRLTNYEYARIQGFPDHHCQVVSTYNQYELYGNAVPPPMVEWILGRIFPDKNEDLWPAINQLEIFDHAN